MLRYFLATGAAIAVAAAVAYGSLLALSKECSTDIAPPKVVNQRSPTNGAGAARPGIPAASLPLESPDKDQTKVSAAEWTHRFVCGIQAGEFAIAAIGFFLALLAGLLLRAIHHVWIAMRDNARARNRETEIIRRAYLSIYPLGIDPFDAAAYAEGHIGIRNVGHLPARKVRWFIEVTPSSDGKRVHFPFGPLTGNNVVHATSEMRQCGRVAISRQEFQNFAENNLWIYVWGTVRYDDGFGNDRYSNFCHRYDTKGFTSRTPTLSFEQTSQLGRATIAAEAATYHQSGNEAD